MLRLRTHWLEPEDDGGGERNGGEEDRRAAIVAGGYAAPVLQAAEHDLDAVTALVAPLVVFDGQKAGFSPRNAGFDPLFLKRISEPVGVVSAVTQQPLRLGKVVEQRGCTGIIADLASGYEEAERATVCIGDGVKLRVHAAFGAADQPSKTPFLTRRLDAVRCAFR